MGAVLTVSTVYFTLYTEADWCRMIPACCDIKAVPYVSRRLDLIEPQGAISSFA